MVEFNSADVEAIVANYQPPEVEFNIPETANLKAKSKAGRESYSFVEPFSRTVRITHIDIAPPFSNAGVRGMVTNVSHGTLHGQPASLIVFSFSLRSGNHGFRFKDANIKITFAKHSSAPSTELNPAILKFAPRKIFGLPTVEGKKDRIGGEISLQVPAGPLTLGPTISGERESEYEKEHRFQIVGNYWSSKHGTDWDIVYWDMRENTKTKQGIPDRLNVAVVVEREGTFTASAEVSVHAGIFAFPWSRNSPVVFVPGVAMGEQPKTSKFEELTDADWREMIPYEEEWENKFTEETLGSGTHTHTPVPGSAAQVAAMKTAPTVLKVVG